MSKFLGETVVDQKDTKYKDYTKRDWVLYYLESWGGIDGAHHKDWTMDQIARILNDTPIIIKEAEWDCGLKEFRIDTGEPTQEYHDWVTEVCKSEDGGFTYSYEVGTPP